MAPLLIPDVVSQNYEKIPGEAFYVYADPQSNGVVTITQLEFARATHRAATLLRPDDDTSAGQVVAILAQSDTLLYHAVVVGLITADLIPFPMSPRNSPAGVFSLLRASGCHRIIATCVTLASPLEELQGYIAREDPGYSLVIEQIPSLDVIYPNLGHETSDCQFQLYSRPRTRTSLDDIALYLHSSGSSGLPRAVMQTHRAFLQYSTLPAIAEFAASTENLPAANMALPCFHQFGVICQLMQPLFGAPIAIYPPTATAPEKFPVVPSPGNILEHARKTGCRSITAVPSLLAAWSHSAESVKYLASLHTVAFSGGPLPPRIGDALVEAGVKLVPVYGGTEFGPISSIVRRQEDAKDWSWHQFSDVPKLRWAAQGDGTFECQFLTWPKFHPMVENLDDVSGYATSDLFVNHPEKKHLWKIIGRVDDVIMHSSGEKTVPGPMENIVASSPFVAGTVMFGRERAQAGILIELVPALQIQDFQDAAAVAELRNKIWPIIAEANTVAPAFSRLFKELVLFTSPGKPLPRTGKATVMRKAALEVYREEIDAIYSEQHIALESEIISCPPETWSDVSSVREWLLNIARSSLGGIESKTPGETPPTIHADTDLFQQGFDSLTATIFRLRLLSALKRSATDGTENPVARRLADGIEQNLVYTYPTVEALAGFLVGLAGAGVTPKLETEMVDLIAKYSLPSQQASGDNGNPSETTRGATTGARIWRTPLCSFVRTMRAPAVPPLATAVVLLTGSTGSLGSQILASLLSDERIGKIWALNRPAGRTLRERHVDTFRERGLDLGLLEKEKLRMVEGTLHEEKLGVESGVYEEILASATHIIHNAWTLDFNMPVSSFESHIAGSRNLAEMALQAVRKPRFVFTSSIASAQLWDPKEGPCPEKIIDDPKVALAGYGQSKYVVEQILTKSELDVCCLRIGQVCGALPKGAWATTDWLPILVKTSVTLGKLPLADGLVSWVDFTTVTQTILDVTFAESERLPTVMNLVHPRPVSWNFVVTSIRDILLKRGKDLELVEFGVWYQELEGRGASGESLPGIKLLSFFAHLAKGSTGTEVGGPRFAVEKLSAISPTLREAGSITREQVEAWMHYWSGFI
ncbi:putative aminoadipate reductase [Roridomyces roridus]|uniref:Aminoadipate reductase n=1 Tax=Roridomyces roridus TaxID=1738132 RepID=A0AAD7B792_9AGAR|nr:putative aminoadipate reductase [Roridomyces roridus]